MGKKQDFTKVKIDDPMWVRWNDIHNDESGWKAKSEVVFSEYAVETLGFFMGLNSDHLMLFADKGGDGDTNTRMFIPVGCVTDWKVISLD